METTKNVQDNISDFSNRKVDDEITTQRTTKLEDSISKFILEYEEAVGKFYKEIYEAKDSESVKKIRESYMLYFERSNLEFRELHAGIEDEENQDRTTAIRNRLDNIKRELIEKTNQILSKLQEKESDDKAQASNDQSSTKCDDCNKDLQSHIRIIPIQVPSNHELTNSSREHIHNTTTISFEEFSTKITIEHTTDTASINLTMNGSVTSSECNNNHIPSSSQRSNQERSTGTTNFSISPLANLLTTSLASALHEESNELPCRPS